MPDCEPGTTTVFVPFSVVDIDALGRLGEGLWVRWVAKGRYDPPQPWED